MTKLAPGDRVAFTAKHVKAMGGSARLGDRRGTYLGPYAGAAGYGLVRWDDIEQVIFAGAGAFAEQDYCDHVRAHGDLAPLGIITKTGSAKFADTYA